MRRASSQNPCPTCGRADWCLVAEDGMAAICARIASNRRCGDAGWLHRFSPAVSRLPRTGRCIGVLPPQHPRFARLAGECRQPCGDRLFVFDKLSALSKDLGISLAALEDLFCGWSMAAGAYTFPMRDAAGDIVGVQYRSPTGKKWTEPGSRLGLFIPVHLLASDAKAERLILSEGASDAAALFDLGFDVAGRPSCGVGVDLCLALVRRLMVREAVVAADADAPGQKGAARLAARLRLQVPEVKVISPPSGHKDVRAWRNAGATQADVLTAIAAAPAISISIRIKEGR